MAIKPIDLPAAAGIDYSGGDVRHFAQGDAVNVPGLSNPTRHLAFRDDLLADKMNEVVQVVNNREQFVPLPVIRTTVPPGEEVVVTNYRIPQGFEARVLNAVVSTVPTTSSAELNVMYSSAFGGSAGTVVVTVTPGSEFNGDVNFYQVGEFIVSMKNTSGVTLEIAGSIMLTMRPVGAEGTLLVASIIQGRQGQPGQRGTPGPPGPPGTGGAGSPGMVWKGPWANGQPYITNDVVSYQYSGTYGSWICRASHTSNFGVNDPQVDPVTWNYVAYGIFSQGTAGPVGPAGGEPTFQDNIVTGFLVTSNTYGTNPYSSDYSASVVSQPNTRYPIACRESIVAKASGTTGLAALHVAYQTTFSGSISVILPRIAVDGITDYNTTSIHLSVMAAGTVNEFGGTVPLFTQQVYTNGWGITVVGATPIPMAFVVSGAQTFP